MVSVCPLTAAMLKQYCENATGWSLYSSIVASAPMTVVAVTVAETVNGSLPDSAVQDVVGMLICSTVGASSFAAFSVFVA